ncbi:DEAD/DEAH box helicase [Aeromonas hydrophila]|uniref:DEAD/DEAH box helicase n=1 Tax=Aeromonas hydrophila TaxID=644 RepID=UPI0005D91D6E|nr:DEAD/DEAH box helicase [Aeromonas hydrophila]AKA16993.1 RNA helicase [Aeromonas hydrophila]HAT2246819.1 DEAD/DEAH box helicase [Aeromonas hydrophila]HAT2383277.1 DEAD/DEAH box helicase [Aeromonas hydrophila]HAT2413865.1 DEAD/DEAH box helicase [Aeromonas hydrophila]HAT2524623.1 DEAD/DEAH box helicase [Aeromonas hydrophila]
MNSKVNLIDKVIADSLESEHFQSLYSELSKGYANYRLGQKSIFKSEPTLALCRYADIFSLSPSPEHRLISYRIVIRLLSISQDKEKLGYIARSIFTKLGLFVSESKFDSHDNPMPYEKELIKLYKKEKQKVQFGEEVLTDSQFDVFSAMDKNQHFSFSGPTSFGKSFLIRNYVYQCINDKKNVVVLVPTKALIDEYLRDIRNKIKDLDWSNINLSKNAKIQEPEKVNVLILTPERFNSFIYSQNRMDIDVLFIDEAHKLGDDDERSITAFKVIQKAKELYPKCKLIFSAPVINNPSVFLESFGLQNSHYKEAKEGPVTQNLFFLDITSHTSYIFNELSNNFEKTSYTINFDSRFELIKHIGALSDSNLIYCSAKTSSVHDAVSFAENLEVIKNSRLSVAAQNIRDLIHDDYYLSELILKGVAYHNADLPKVVRGIIEDLYQSRLIKYIFCTSTLLEGVNLPTGNLFLQSFSHSNKVTNKSKLDFWNLAGRAGRYTKELDGNIFCIKDSSTTWANLNDLVDGKNNIKANATALKTLERGQKIINVLTNGILNESSKTERMMDQITNIIIADYMDRRKENKSSRIIELVPKKFHRRLLVLLESKFKEYGLEHLPTILLASGHNISLDKHLNVMEDVRENPLILNSIGNADIYNMIARVCDVYRLKYTEKQVNRLYRIAQNWIKGHSVKQIINNTIDNTDTVMITHGVIEPFDKSNKKHINIIINSVISTIENDIGYTLELFVNSYHLNLSNYLGEDAAGINLATYLELGTRDKFEIALQNYGFTRYAASEINKNMRTAITFDSNIQVVSINKDKLLHHFDKNSLTYLEIERI